MKKTTNGRGMMFAAIVVAGFAPVASTAKDNAQITTTPPAFMFNWHANRSTVARENALALARERQLAAARNIGSGTWICSPAGFGRKSRCMRN